jgi:hypothetical protein
LGSDRIISLLEEIARTDLEVCADSIRAGDQTAALTAIETVFAKLDSAIDMVRNQGGSDRR